MKVLVFIDQLHIGGAARVTVSMCNGLAKYGYDVLVACDNTNYNIFYPLEENVEVLTFNNSAAKNFVPFLSAVNNYKSLIKNARQIISSHKPDVVIAVLPNIFFVVKLAMFGFKIPIVACDHTSFDRKVNDKIAAFVRSSFYGTADALSILTKRDELYLGKKFPKKQVFYNPLSFDILKEETIRKKNILCVGRLDVWDVKGFDIIISIWKLLSKEYPDWVLEIAGDGKRKSYAKLNALIEEAGLEGRVKLLGQIENIQDYLAHTSVFALPSRVEGFPMSLLEALSQGCASVAFNVGGASSEMITDRNAGIVIPDGDINAFTIQLRNVLKDEKLRLSMSVHARTNVEKFSLESFTLQWVKLISDLISSK